MKATSSLGSKGLFSLTWPLFCDLALHFLTGALNTFMIGLVSYQSVAALAVGNQVFDLAISLFSFVSIGTSVVITQYLGAGDAPRAQRVTYTAISFNLLVGLFAAVAIIGGAPVILDLMNLPAHLLGEGTLYLQIIGICLLPEAAALCLAATLRAHGHTKEAMYVTLIINLITFAGNLLLLFGWFGLPKLGVEGVAISTITGRLIGVVLLGLLVAKKTQLTLSWTKFVRIERPMLKKVLHIGLPAAGENIAWMLQFMTITAFVALLGDKTLASQSYFFQICLFIMLFGFSIGLGNEIVVGHLVGARQFDAAYSQLMRSLKLGVVVTVVITVFAALNGRHIIGLMTDDAEIIEQVAQLFLISLILEPGRTFNLVVINALRAAGDARFPLLMALISMWGIAVPLSYFLGIDQGHGLVGVWIAIACDEWVRAMAMLWRWRSKRWQSKSLVDEPLGA
ncbi:MAG: MATE family efflux transporter [Vibrionaceae bacterium]